MRTILLKYYKEKVGYLSYKFLEGSSKALFAKLLSVVQHIAVMKAMS